MKIIRKPLFREKLNTALRDYHLASIELKKMRAEVQERVSDLSVVNSHRMNKSRWSRGDLEGMARHEASPRLRLLHSVKGKAVRAVDKEQRARKNLFYGNIRLALAGKTARKKLTLRKIKK